MRIFVDMMRAYYGIREVNGTDGKRMLFDFSTLGDYDLNLKVNVGASAYWSEIEQKTQDNFFARL